MTAEQLAQRMNAPLGVVHGLLEAADPQSKDACVWIRGNAMRVAKALDLPINTIVDMIVEGKIRRN